MTDAQATGKRGFRQRLGLSKGSKPGAPRQRLTKKNALQPQVDGENAGFGADFYDEEEEEWRRRPSMGYDVAPEDRYRQTQEHPPPQQQNVTRWVPAAPQDPHKGVIDKDTGERMDMTEMMHALYYDETVDDSFDYILEEGEDADPDRPRGEIDMSKLSAEIWVHITEYLEVREAANLALTCKTIWWLLGSRPFDNLRLGENIQQRIEFLLPMDKRYPGQLFCFPCATYHVRTHPGQETLKPTIVLNPLFACPNRTNSLIPPPRHRISPGRTIPFTFVQLVTRAWRHGLEYGIPVEELSRRWRDQWSDWTHQTRFHIHKNGHLLMRVVSQVFADPELTLAAKRMLLYSRDDYTPYFSVCAHWRDGLLMDVCKCALGHIPGSKYRTVYLGGPRASKPGILTLCGECRPMRRCPQCPSEYLIEVKLVEDRNVASGEQGRFKQALIVTRWTDLGDGISPQGDEWSAVQGESDGFDSFQRIVNRSISGVFEAAFGDHYPNQRLLSLNPKNTRKGEAGNSWY